MKEFDDMVLNPIFRTISNDRRGNDKREKMPQVEPLGDITFPRKK
jgi:hypothetical protein